jgi:hypothetical protein
MELSGVKNAAGLVTKQSLPYVPAVKRHIINALFVVARWRSWLP